MKYRALRYALIIALVLVSTYVVLSHIGEHDSKHGAPVNYDPVAHCTWGTVSTPFGPVWLCNEDDPQ